GSRFLFITNLSIEPIENKTDMKKLSIIFLSMMALLVASCSDDVSPSETYKGYFVDSEGGMRYDYYQEPDTVLLVLKASNVPCDSTKTVEEVPCGDTPVYLGNTYILSLSDKTAVLTIGTSAEKYDYVADKTVRRWDFHEGEYNLNKAGYEEYKMLSGVYKAIVVKDHVNFTTKIAFMRKVEDKDELAFVKNGPFMHTEYGPKRMQHIELPASVKECHLSVSKTDEYNWTLTGEDVEYRFHIQELDLIQTKQSYKIIGKLSPTN
ncbi:hypothetical protein, partial [Xylanibacter rodentium]|uniref:hypothetical protein n=1 Tax=Xylanibacter rodentium TaxID=2736289 RepID=UPI002599D4F7